MKRTKQRVHVMQGWFKAIERTAWTDGNDLYVKIKGNVHRIKECGTGHFYQKEANRMVEMPVYMTV